MAVTVTMPPNQAIPDGTAIAAYVKRECEVERNTSQPPIPASKANGTVAEGKVSFSGLTADLPYVAIAFVNEVQSVKVDATAGQFKLTFEGQQTANIAFNATAAKVKEELVALSNVAEGDVEVTGGPGSSGGGTPYVVKFLATYAGTNVAAMTGANGTTPLSGGGAAITITTTTEGSKAGASNTQRYVLFTGAA